MLVGDFVEYSVSGCVSTLAVMIKAVSDALGERAERCDDQWEGQCGEIDRVQ